MKVRVSKDKIVDAILEYFEKEKIEIDNLGDGESIYFMGNVPTINLVELSEYIERALTTGSEAKEQTR